MSSRGARKRSREGHGARVDGEEEKRKCRPRPGPPLSLLERAFPLDVWECILYRLELRDVVSLEMTSKTLSGITQEAYWALIRHVSLRHFYQRWTGCENVYYPWVVNGLKLADGRKAGELVARISKASRHIPSCGILVENVSSSSCFHTFTHILREIPLRHESLKVKVPMWTELIRSPRLREADFLELKRLKHLELIGAVDIFFRKNQRVIGKMFFRNLEELNSLKLRLNTRFQVQDLIGMLAKEEKCLKNLREISLRFRSLKRVPGKLFHILPGAERLKIWGTFRDFYCGNQKNSEGSCDSYSEILSGIACQYLTSFFAADRKRHLDLTVVLEYIHPWDLTLAPQFREEAFHNFLFAIKELQKKKHESVDETLSQQPMKQFEEWRSQDGGSLWLKHGRAQVSLSLLSRPNTLDGEFDSEDCVSLLLKRPTARFFRRRILNS